MQLISALGAGPARRSSFTTAVRPTSLPGRLAETTTRNGPLRLLPRQPARALRRALGAPAGCRRWFNAVRDTADHQMLAVYSSRPETGATAMTRLAGRGRVDRGTELGSPSTASPTPDSPVTRWPRRCWPTACTTYRPASSSAGRVASSPPAWRMRPRWSRSTRRSPSRCCRRRRSSCTTGSSRTACPARAGSPTRLTRRGTTPCTRTATSSSWGRTERPGCRVDRRARRGRVILVDDQPEAGGRYWVSGRHGGLGQRRR